MSVQVRIRSVDGLEEADSLEYMQLACLPTDVLYPTNYGFWWIAYDGSDHVAFAGLKVLPYDTGYLCRSGVMPKYRGLGLQARLIRARQIKARSVGLTTIVTDTNFNPASANSLIRCGFKTYIPSEPWSFSTAIYWKKTLA